MREIWESFHKTELTAQKCLSDIGCKCATKRRWLGKEEINDGSAQDVETFSLRDRLRIRCLIPVVHALEARSEKRAVLCKSAAEVLIIGWLECLKGMALCWCKSAYKRLCSRHWE